MGQLSRGARGKSPGKLLDVLRHGLRGIQGAEENLANSYRERGLPVPAHISAPPRIADNYQVYWQAYADLQHERPLHPTGKMMRIPWSAIANYCQHHGLNVDEMKRYIWALDSEFLTTKMPAPQQERPPNG